MHWRKQQKKKLKKRTLYSDGFIYDFLFIFWRKCFGLHKTWHGNSGIPSKNINMFKMRDVTVISLHTQNRTQSIRSEFTFCMPENHQSDIYFHPLFWWVDDCIVEWILFSKLLLVVILSKVFVSDFFVSIIKNQFLSTVSYPISILIFWQRSK